MAKSITYIGLDVHKYTIAVALAEASLSQSAHRRLTCTDEIADRLVGLMIR